MAAQDPADRRTISLPDVHIATRVRAMALAGAETWADRRENAWLALVAVPLAMTATALLGQWWTWPILLAESAMATRTWRWSWLLSLELAYVGATWAFVGANALALWPKMTVLVGIAWAAFPAVLVVGVSRQRRQPMRGAFMWPPSRPRAPRP